MLNICPGKSSDCHSPWCHHGAPAGPFSQARAGARGKGHPWVAVFLPKEQLCSFPSTAGLGVLGYKGRFAESRDHGG